MRLLALYEEFRLLRMVVGEAKASHSVWVSCPLAAHEAEQTMVLAQGRFGRLWLCLGGGIGHVHETLR